MIDPDPTGAHHDITLTGDIDGDGRPDIVGKPYRPERHVDVWFNETPRR